MSNSDAFAIYEGLSLFETDLPSGVHAKGQYMDMETAIMAGGFDFSALQSLSDAAAADKEGADADPEAVKEGLRYKRFVVCHCLRELNGSPVVEMSDEEYALMTDADRTTFFNLAIRAEAPLAAAV